MEPARASNYRFRGLVLAPAFREQTLNPWYSHTASLMIAVGKRKPRYGLVGVLMPGNLPRTPPASQPDSTCPGSADLVNHIPVLTP